MKRRKNFGDSGRDDRLKKLECLRSMAKIRCFADRSYREFETSEDFHSMSCRRDSNVGDDAVLPEVGVFASIWTRDQLTCSPG